MINNLSIKELVCVKIFVRVCIFTISTVKEQNRFNMYVQVFFNHFFFGWLSLKFYPYPVLAQFFTFGNKHSDILLLFVSFSVPYDMVLEMTICKIRHLLTSAVTKMHILS